MHKDLNTLLSGIERGMAIHGRGRDRQQSESKSVGGEFSKENVDGVGCYGWLL